MRPGLLRASFRFLTGVCVGLLGLLSLLPRDAPAEVVNSVPLSVIATPRGALVGEVLSHAENEQHVLVTVKDSSNGGGPRRSRLSCIAFSSAVFPSKLETALTTN